MPANWDVTAPMEVVGGVATLMILSAISESCLIFTESLVEMRMC